MSSETIKPLLVTIATLALGAVLLTAVHRRTEQRQQEIAAERRRITAARAAEATLRAETAADVEALQGAKSALVALEARLAVQEKYGPPPPAVWRERIERLKARMRTAVGAGHAPELRLLELKDWIDAAARAEDATPAELQDIIGALRQTARVRAATRIRDALRAFTQASGGELPLRPQDLLPYLREPFTADMLDGYVMLRTGKLAAEDEKVMEWKQGDESLQVGVNSWTTHGSPLVLLSEFGREMAGSGDGLDMLRAVQSAMPEIAQRIPAFPDVEKQQFGERLKAAVRRYQQANGGATPATLFELSGEFPEAREFAEHFRIFFAEFEYLVEHRGALPESDGRLKRYLEYVDAARVMRRLALKQDGNSVEVSFNLNY